MVAALYCVLTLALHPLSFRALQFRVSEALTLLPVLTADAVPGLFVGCLLANLLGGAIWYDVIFGALATLMAAFCTLKLREKPFLAAAMPVAFNGLIVGPVVYFEFLHAGTIQWGELFGTMGTVALGEAAVCFTLGLLLVRTLSRLPEETWE